MKDRSYKFKNLACFLIFASSLLSVSSEAVSLNPGETVSLSGTSSALRPEIARPILDEQVASFAHEINGIMVTGAVSQRLRRFLGDSLLIDYRITSFDDQGLGLQIDTLMTQGFFGDINPLDVDYRLDEAGNVAPVTASKQVDFGVGAPVAFDFNSSPLLSGDTSRWIFVGDPNNFGWDFGSYGAQLLGRDTAGAQFSIPFASYQLFLPIPASLPLLATGLIGLIGIARRKKVA